MQSAAAAPPAALITTPSLSAAPAIDFKGIKAGEIKLSIRGLMASHFNSTHGITTPYFSIDGTEFFATLVKDSNDQIKARIHFYGNRIVSVVIKVGIGELGKSISGVVIAGAEEHNHNKPITISCKGPSPFIRKDPSNTNAYESALITSTLGKENKFCETENFCSLADLLAFAEKHAIVLSIKIGLLPTYLLKQLFKKQDALVGVSLIWKITNIPSKFNVLRDLNNQIMKNGIRGLDTFSVNFECGGKAIYLNAKVNNKIPAAGRKKWIGFYVCAEKCSGFSFVYQFKILDSSHSCHFTTRWKDSDFNKKVLLPQSCYEPSFIMNADKCHETTFAKSWGWGIDNQAPLESSTLTVEFDMYVFPPVVEAEKDIVEIEKKKQSEETFQLEVKAAQDKVKEEMKVAKENELAERKKADEMPRIKKQEDERKAAEEMQRIKRATEEKRTLNAAKREQEKAAAAIFGKKGEILNLIHMERKIYKDCSEKKIQTEKAKVAEKITADLVILSCRSINSDLETSRTKLLNQHMCDLNRLPTLQIHIITVKKAMDEANERFAENQKKYAEEIENAKLEKLSLVEVAVVKELRELTSIKEKLNQAIDAFQALVNNIINKSVPDSLPPRFVMRREDNNKVICYPQIKTIKELLQNQGMGVAPRKGRKEEVDAFPVAPFAPAPLAQLAPLVNSGRTTSHRVKLWVMPDEFASPAASERKATASTKVSTRKPELTKREEVWIGPRASEMSFILKAQDEALRGQCQYFSFFLKQDDSGYRFPRPLRAKKYEGDEFDRVISPPLNARKVSAGVWSRADYEFFQQEALKDKVLVFDRVEADLAKERLDRETAAMEYGLDRLEDWMDREEVAMAAELDTIRKGTPKA